jgi:hypothetical protein
LERRNTAVTDPEALTVGERWRLKKRYTMATDLEAPSVGERRWTRRRQLKRRETVDHDDA